tara:strand:+ start:330 stop:569 length:240 start_codon:yes stop_codon:yes gene_type:complete
MSTQVDQEPILELDGQKYIISELPEEARTLLGRIQANEVELANAQLAVERLSLSKDSYTKMLKEAVEQSESPPEGTEVS